MKKLSYVFYLVLAVVSVSCTEQKSNSVNEESNNRIKLNEVRIINGYGYSILEVDGKEYLTQDKGGFIEITK